MTVFGREGWGLLARYQRCIVTVLFWKMLRPRCDSFAEKDVASGRCDSLAEKDAASGYRIYLEIQYVFRVRPQKKKA